MDSLLVVGVDPGPVPGVAVLAYENGRPVCTPSLFQCDAGSVIWLVRECLSSTVRVWDARLLAVERFVVSTRAARSSTAQAGQLTRDLVGALKVLGSDAGVIARFRSASEVKPWATDNRLARIDLGLAPKGMPHARDAARHALFAAVHDGGLPDPLSRRARGVA